MAQQHVPAWRKLGLKLKYARDEASSTSEANPNAKLQTAHDQRSVKNLKSTISPTCDYSKIELAQSPASGKLARRNDAAEDLGPSKKKQKSVAFTPETKERDGDSARELFDEWRRGEGLENAELTQPALQASKKISQSDPSATGKKSKRSKTPKSTLLAANPADTKDALNQTFTSHSPKAEPSTQVLEYLDLFHKDRANWKFNKARQNQVFKQTFDLSRIPYTHDEALLSYIAGLQGTAARNHLRERALEVRESDNNEFAQEIQSDDLNSTLSMKDPRNQLDRTSSDEERQRAAYLSALRHLTRLATWDVILAEENEHQLTETWERRLYRRIRAEKIMRTVGESMEEVARVATVNTPLRNKTGVDFEVSRVVEQKLDQNGRIIGAKRKRKRKRRTTMPDEDSSEEESSSSSSSEDDSDEEATLKRLKTAELSASTANGLQDAESETSSNSLSDGGQSTSSDGSSNDDED